MKLLYEDLLANPEVSSEIKEALIKATIIRIDNVFQYRIEHNNKFGEDGFYQTIKEYPVLTTPFETLWLEFTDPKPFLYSTGETLSPLTIGSLITRTKMDNIDRSSIQNLFRFADAHWHIKGLQFTRRTDPISKNTYLQLLDGRNTSYIEFLLNKDGTLYCEGKNHYFKGGMTDEYKKSVPDINVFNITDPRDDDVEYISPVLMAVSLMNCKNVTIEDAEPFKGEKKKRNRHNQPRTKYHVLKIKSMTTRRGTGEYTGGGIPSMHIRRGHFKQFTDDKPLFGRWAGLYWWEAAVVGKKSKTKVIKDYEVIPPADDFSENQEQNN